MATHAKIQRRAQRPQAAGRDSPNLRSTQCHTRKTPIVTFGKKNTSPIDIALFLQSFRIARCPVSESSLDHHDLFASAAGPPGMSFSSDTDGSSVNQDQISTHPPGYDNNMASTPGKAGVRQTTPSGSVLGTLQPFSPNQLLEDADGKARVGSQDTIETADSHRQEQSPKLGFESPRFGCPTPLMTIRRRLSSIKLVPRNIRKLRKHKDRFNKASRSGDRFTKSERVLTYRLKPRQQPLRLRTKPSERSKLRSLQLCPGPLPDVVFLEPEIRPLIATTEYIPGLRQAQESNAQSVKEVKLSEAIKKELSSLSAPIRPASVDERSSSEVEEEMEAGIDEENSSIRSSQSLNDADDSSQTILPARSREMLPVYHDHYGFGEPISDTLSAFGDQSEDDMVMLGARPIVSPLTDNTRSFADELLSQDEDLLAPISSPSPDHHSDSTNVARKHESDPGQHSTVSMAYEDLLDAMPQRTAWPQRQRSILKNSGHSKRCVVEPGSTAENTRYNRNITGEQPEHLQGYNPYFSSQL